MQHQIICTKSNGLFLFSNFIELTDMSYKISRTLYKIIYNGGETALINIGDTKKVLKKGEVMFCKPSHVVEIVNPNSQLQVVGFNKTFYDLKTLDEEMNFYGFWFFGFKQNVTIALNYCEQHIFSIMFNNIKQKFSCTTDCSETKCNFLKQIILTTSSKLQIRGNTLIVTIKQLNIIKHFSKLIEENNEEDTSFKTMAQILPQNVSFQHQLVS